MAPLTKVLFIGIDAGDRFLLQSWAADGTLKNFRSLLAGGLTGDTLSLDGFFEGATWPSFYTGVSPARHGFHRLVQLRPGTYELYPSLPGESVKREPFWNSLSRAGKRVAILDVPLSSISGSINGIQTVEWGSHDAAYGFQAWPPELKQEVHCKFGPHPMRDACDLFGQDQRLSALRDLLVEGVKRKAMLTNHFLKKGGWDFLAQVFTESHCIGHQCFHLHDPGHPGYDPKTAAAAGDLMRDVYIALDSAVGDILEHVSPETVVVLLASHRMSHNFGAQFLLSDILIGLKVAERFLSRAEAGRLEATRERLSLVLGWCWRHMPRSAKERLLPFRNRARSGLVDNRIPPPFSIHGIDPRKSMCFPLDNGLSVGGIRLNVTGREPDGIVEPGEEVDALCRDLSLDLLAIIECDSGLPIVKSVKKTAELYQGEYLSHLPDLLVEWNDAIRIGSAGTANPRGSKLVLASDRMGRIEGTNAYCRTGDHRREGLFVAIGPGITRGHLERTVSIMDFAPTFADLLGVGLDDAEGEPISEISMAARPLT